MKPIKYLIILAFFFLLGVKAYAQITITHSLTLEAARKVAEVARQYAIDNQAPGGTIAIVDHSGYLIYLERLDNSFPASANVATEKARTAAAFQFPTSKLEDAITGGRSALITVGYTMLRGGVPIIHEGQMVGAIGVSGAASAQQDEEIAMAGSQAIIQ